jgi:hypothetical protein
MNILIKSMEYLKNNNLVINDLLPIISDYLSPTKEEWKEKFIFVLYDINNLNTKVIFMSLEHYQFITDSGITEDDLGDDWLYVELTFDSENCRDCEFNLKVYSEDLEEEYYIRNINNSSAISLILSNYE